MTKFLLSPENPKGWKLEEILQEIENDILIRCTLISEDTRIEARTVLHNNIQIMQWLTECIEKANETTRILASLGPSRGPSGERRIGGTPDTGS